MFDLDEASGGARDRLAANVCDRIGRRLAEAIGRAAQ